MLSWVSAPWCVSQCGYTNTTSLLPRYTPPSRVSFSVSPSFELADKSFLVHVGEKPERVMVVDTDY